MKWRMDSEEFYSIEYKSESGNYIEHCALFRTEQEAREFAAHILSSLKWWIVIRTVWTKVGDDE